MGDNTLATVQDGTVGNPEQVNQYKEALVGNVVPRNPQGEADDKAGSSGESSNKWSTVHTQELDLYGNIRLNGTKVTKEYSSSSSWECPDGVYELKVLCGGSGGNGQVGGVRVGGCGGATAIISASVTPSSVYSITIGSDASFGALLTAEGGENGAAGAIGGGFSVANGEELILAVAGGEAGNAGANTQGKNAADGSQGGGGGYTKGANATNGVSGGGGGGYFPPSGATGGAAGVLISYHLPDGVVDPN